MLTVTGRLPLANRARHLQPLGLHAASLAIDRDVTQLCGALTDDQLSWSPGPGNWCIAQILAHLRITTEVFLPVVDAALETSKALDLRSAGPFPLSLYGRVLVWQMESRPIRLRSPKAVLPCLLGSPSAELQGFIRSQAAMRQRLEAASGLDLTARRFPSPLVTCFRVNLLEFFSLSNAHARRHLRQANRLRQALLLS